jgi:peroxiredoxin
VRPWTSLLLAGLVGLAAAACTGAEDDPAGATATLEDADAEATDTAVAAGDGEAGADDAVSPTPSTSPAPAAPAVDVVEETAPANAPALDFSARRLTGGTIDGAQLAGGDVVLWMWAPWCPQCNREATHVADAVAAFSDRVTFVGVAGHDTDEAHRAFVAEHGLGDMLHVVDDDGSVWEYFGVSYQPAWVFVDEDGTTDRVAGGLYDDLPARLQALVDR